MKSNNKIVVNRIREHIKDCLSTDNTQDLGEQLQAVAKGFHNWYGEYEQKAVPNRQQAFMQWLLCLPSELSVEFYHNKQRKVMAVLMEGVSAPRKELVDSEIQNRYLGLIYREFSKMCKENGIDF